MISAMLLRQYRILYHMRCLMEERIASSALPGLLGLPPFAVTRTQTQARQAIPRSASRPPTITSLSWSTGSNPAGTPGSAKVAALFMLEGILHAALDALPAGRGGSVSSCIRPNGQKGGVPQCLSK